MSKAKKEWVDETLYACFQCEYDGGGYKDGAEGWVDPDGDLEEQEGMCASCCCPVEDFFRCDKCRKWLAGKSYCAPNDPTPTLCGKCSGWGSA